MATTYKTLTNNDTVSTRTLLHEAIPVTGSIISGSYAENNIKNYAHGMFQSTYDYPYLSSSANHIFDVTCGYSTLAPGYTVGTTLSASTNTQNAKKVNVYNQMAQVLMGYDHTGSIQRFDEDGNILAGGTKIDACYFLNLSRLLVKDEIKKGSFELELGVTPLAAAATATITMTDYDEVGTGNSISIVTTAGDTVTITGHGSATAMTDTTGESLLGTWQSATSNNVNATNIAAALSLHDDLTATALSAVVTITQSVTGTAGNTAITLVDPGTDGMTKTDFTGGTGGAQTGHTDPFTVKRIKIHDASASNDFRVNSPAGEYGILEAVNGNGTTAAALAGENVKCGLIFYQAGIAVISASVFNSADDGGLLSADGTYTATHGFNSTSTVVLDTHGAADGNGLMSSFQQLTASTISGAADSFRRRIYNLQFNNTTELNSTIYFCRVNHNDFNYSSNPTYLDSSQIRVKNTRSDSPVSYITTVGLYSADNELLAVAKVSEPLKKDPTTELTLRVRLDY
jgi:hypothetical protein